MTATISDRPTLTYSGSLRTRRIEVNGFNVMDATFPPGMTCGIHYHELPSLAVVLEGSITKHYASGKHLSATHSLYTTPSGARHELEVGELGLRLLILEAAGGEPSPALPGRRLFEQVTARTVPDLALLARQMAAELRQADEFSEMVIEGLSSALLAAAARSDRGNQPRLKRPPWLDRVEQRMHEEDATPTRIAALAEEAGVHPVHLTRVFRQHYGMTPGTYLRALRLQRAAAELASTDLPLGQLARRAGFSDQSHFTRAFKRCFGTTPARYRAGLKS